MLNTEKKIPSIEEQERAGRLREVINALYEVNKLIPIIVEGKNDAAALKKLGFVGEIITLHRGVSLYDFSENIMENYPKVILLTDWDNKGETLYRTLSANLSGHYEDFTAFRGMLKVLCQKDIKDIEGIPRLLGRLEGPMPMPGEWEKDE